MKNRILSIAVLALFALALTNCGTIFQGARQTVWDDSSPNTSMLSLIPKNLPPNQKQSGEGWERIMEIGPAEQQAWTQNRRAFGRCESPVIRPLYTPRYGKPPTCFSYE